METEAVTERDTEGTRQEDNADRERERERVL